ncbi:MAG: hypothetical protein KKF44_09260 [Nanoarchaeota archaeon]|nr:hypothetical protein [Nanoarchaeota archaeon]
MRQLILFPSSKNKLSNLFKSIFSKTTNSKLKYHSSIDYIPLDKKDLKKKIKELEDYLGPIMDYQDRGIVRIPYKYRPEAVFIFEYYVRLKNELYSKKKHQYKKFKKRYTY